ncbi:hypothetical protein [Prosthecobacter sp.]|uniref:hypothetical protein n=1 Tax=Prosthecobacter sp. TaxID=1965333 RepID=UPI003784D2A7
MRRPWIKIETCTPDKPEICSLATQLKLDEDTVVGKLVRLWSWAELNRIQPNDIGVTKEFIDKLVGRKGFAAALAQTGWLEETEGKLSFRNFKRHNSPVAQNKALTAKRVARHRLRKSVVNEKDTFEPLAGESQVERPKAKGKVKKGKSVKEVKVTIEPLPDAVIEVGEVVESATYADNSSDVFNPDSALEIKDDVGVASEPENVVSVTVADEPATSVKEDETLPVITPQEALAALQVEEPAPKKKRSKATAESDDQPMLF